MKNYTITCERWALENGKLYTAEIKDFTVQAESALEAYGMIEGEWASKSVKSISEIIQPEPQEPNFDTCESIEVAPITESDYAEYSEQVATTTSNRAQFCTAIINDGLQQKYGFVSGDKSRLQVEPPKEVQFPSDSEDDTDVVIPVYIPTDAYETIYITYKAGRFVFRNQATVGQGAFFSCPGAKTSLVYKKIDDYLSEGRHIVLEGFELEGDF